MAGKTSLVFTKEAALLFFFVRRNDESVSFFRDVSEKDEKSLHPCVRVSLCSRVCACVGVFLYSFDTDA